MSVHRYLVPCTYIFIEEMLMLHVFGKQFKPLSTVFAFCVWILLMALLFIMFAAYTLANLTMRLLLLLWYRNRYGGVLGMDSYFECTKSYITTVYIIEHCGTFEDLHSAIKQSCSRLYRSHFKFSSVIRSIWGFYFFVKNMVSLDDVIFIENYMEMLTKDKLIDYLEKLYFNSWIDNSLWKVVLFNKPISWKSDSKVYYPVVIRYNHCIGDGVALAAFAQRFLLNDVRNECFEKVIRRSPKSTDILKTSNIGTVFLAGPALEYSTLNSINPTQNLALFVEEEPKYIDLIRYISKRLNCSFTDVIMTAAVASLTNYLKLEGSKPKNLIVYNTTRPLGDNFELVLQGKMLRNGFTLDAFNLPWMKEEKMLSRFNEIITVLNDGRKSATGQIIYLLWNTLSYLHPALMTKFTRYNSIGTTLGITNIPFADFGKIGKCPLKDIFSFVNHFEETKFILVIFSYEGRLQATLSTKRYLKTSRAELQLILNNIFSNIDNLYEEVKLA